MKVTETVVPTGYSGLPGEVIVTVSYDTSTRRVTGISFDSYSSYFKTSIGDTGKITVINSKTTISNLTLLKTDMDGNKMKNVEFTIYFNNLNAFTYDETTYKISDFIIDEMQEIEDDVYVKRVNVDGDDNRIYIYGLTTNNNGEIVFPELQVNSTNTTVYVTIQETESKNGYEMLPSNLKLLLKYDESSNEWKLEERTGESNTNNNNKLESKYWSLDPDNLVLIQLKNQKIPSIRIGGDVEGSGFDKYAKGTETAIPGVKFEAVFEQGSTTITKTATSDNSGHVSFEEFQPESTENVKVTITEIETPKGWQGNFSKIIEFTYDDNDPNNVKWKTTDSKVNVQLSEDKKTTHVGLEDPAENSAIIGLTILKKDQLTGANLDGVKFNLTFSNVSAVGKTKATDGEVTISETVTNGKIEIEDIVIADTSKNVKVEITEDENSVPPNYKKIEGKITLTLTKGESTLSGTLSKDNTVLDTEVSTDSLSINGTEHTVTIDIKNHEIINLSGQVWIDGQTGEKNATNPDGKKGNNEEKINGVKVHLYSIEKNDKISTVTTDTDGKYAFNNIIKTKDGYKIYFEYNGIVYEDVGIKEDSKAAEEVAERTALNNKFKTIDVNGSVINGNKGIEIEYNPYNSGKKTTEFKSTVQGTKPEDSAIEAKTEVYKQTTNNIDCGLLKRTFDLAIGTDVEEAKLTINGKETTYTYKQIIDGKLEDAILDATLNKKLSDIVDIPTYNLYLYLSDYNFRIEDYKTDVEGNTLGEVTTNELDVYITYSVILKNQTTHSALVDEFAYYYNGEVYTPILKTGDIVDGYEVREIKNNKITFISVESEENKLQDNANENKKFRKQINITFKVNKNSEGYIILKDDIRNAAEIIKYSTVEGGLIDRDSRPGNANITINGNGNPTVVQYEDDTNEAKGINIQVNNSKQREISGTVFDDTNVNGLKDDGTTVKDVIVQLIEIKNISGVYNEYIWQETRSGNSEVRRTNPDTGAVDKEPNANADLGDGEYRFKDFIPGNYIIRFIYGDGRSWDVTPNVEKYNGQDYQSTIDKNYNKIWYNTSIYEENSSVATDNEARRLKTMAYTVEVDGKIGIAIKSINTEFKDLGLEEKNLVSSYYSDILDYYNVILKNADETDIEKIAEKIALEEVSQDLYGNKILPNANDNTKIKDYYEFVKKYALQKTWMSAETSKINIPVDAETIKTDEDKTTVSGTANVSVILEYMNFGLRKRPETKLTVEKHITELTITPSTSTGVGVQPIVNARVNIDDMLSGNINDDTIEGRAIGLAIIPSTRTERGFWKLETDIEELAQGATLEVEYTYVLKNESDDYYLSNSLLNEYRNNINDLSQYKAFLEDESDKAKQASTIPTLASATKTTKGNVLGKYYYTNQKDSEVSGNIARIDKLEEPVNNKLQYIESIAGESFNQTNENRVKKNFYNEEGIMEEREIETILGTKSATEILEIGGTEKNRTLRLKTTISSLTNGEIGATLDSYITQIASYSNAAGRVNLGTATPGNLEYIHNEDKRATLESYVQKDNNGTYKDKISPTATSGYVKLNECDEFWAETIIISKPTGQDKNTPMLITIIAISSVAVLGVGIILIKKLVLKK